MKVIFKIADNIVSPLGFTTAENFSAVMSGRSAIRRYEDKWDIPAPFMASLIDRDALDHECSSLPLMQHYTCFEKMILLSVSKALENSGVQPDSDRVLFIVSTTKGNVDLLYENKFNLPPDRILCGVTARVICDYFHNPNPPIVVSNACISGVCAQIAAMRNLFGGRYDYVIVTGADCQSRFIVTGFQSLKALSPDLCRPFDKDRKGLNLGDAAATIIYSVKDEYEMGPDDWVAVDGSIRNDANHISGPSRSGEGSYRTLVNVLHDTNPDDIAFVNVHGTATVYNDEMESIALYRAGLQAVPVNGLKGYYGHTMGAAGVIETILSMCAVDNNVILATRGYETCGVSYPLSLSNEIRHTDKRSFIKLLSGFGGCNAAILFKKGGAL